ncbi:hypothetical protein QFE97_13765 [Bacillus subtilis]|nr:hypothetical protein QFE97_13765 [Bacillus subtilis]
MTETNWVERFAGSVARGFTGYAGSVFPILGAVSLAVAPFLIPDASTFGWILVWIGISLTLCGVIALVFVRPSYWKLRDEHERLTVKANRLSVELGEERRTHKASLVAMLNHVARRALIAAAPDTELDRCRISVYVERESQFVLVARWSANEKLRRPGREQFPMGEGLIGEAWDGVKGAAHVEGLTSEEDKWIQDQCDAYRFEESVVRALTMRARSIAAVRVEGEKKTPIVVVESLEPKLLGLRATLDLRKSEPFKEIARIVSDSDIIIPKVHESLTIATTETAV